MMAVDAGIYGGGPLYSEGAPLIDDLRSSGMTTIVAWSVHVASGSGDLIFNDPVIVSNGSYVGEASWPEQLALLKQSPTSVQRLLFSVGAGGVDDFHHIQQLIQQQGVGPKSILYRNFAALKAAIPGIDGIDFDDEDLFDRDTTVAFASMLHQLGYEVTFCPYMMLDYWVECLKKLNTAAPGLVVGFNLQCYSGGEGNSPGPWIQAVAEAMGPDFDAAGFVRPGLWCANTPPDCSQGQCPDSIESTLKGWQPSGIRGGWIWLLDDLLKCQDSGACTGGSMDIAAYANAIVNALAANAAQ